MTAFKGMRREVDGVWAAVFGPEGVGFPFRGEATVPTTRLAQETSWTNILDEVRRELRAQQRKWGDQHHPDGCGPHTWPLDEHIAASDTAEELAGYAKEVNARLVADGELTWAQVLLEEFFEALAEEDGDALEAELIQVAAVAVQWVHSRRRDA